MKNNNTGKDKKWEFDDYAFTLTGILVGFLLVVPELLYSRFGISILGGGGLGEAFADGLDNGYAVNRWSINELRALSPMLFLLTTTICLFQDAIVARKNGGYKGSMFTHTFESLLEDAIYMAVTTAMVYGAVFAGAMYASWLAGPITWILFVVIFPLVRKKSGSITEVKMPWLLLLIFTGGIIAEVITGAWVAFPLSWLIICIFKFAAIFREKVSSVDTIFNIMYYAFSIILLAVGLSLDFWLASWAAFPVALFICWVLSKFRKYRQPSKNHERT